MKLNWRSKPAGGTAAIASWIAAAASALYATAGHAEWALNFQQPVTTIGHVQYQLHMLILWICVAIFVVVFGVMFYSLYAHRKSKGSVPSNFSHSTKAEVIWTIIPVAILVGMAIPSTAALIEMEDTTESDMTVKVTGYQWKWQYEYLDHDVNFYSTLATPRSQIEGSEPKGENYLLEVDKHVVLPVNQKVRILLTAADVLHAWWVPAFGAKKDAIPGFVNEIWVYIEEPGTYRGQCAELCGKDHAYMPIVVDAVSQEAFDAWVAENRATGESG